MSEAKNTVALAISSVLPPRFNGMLSLHPCTVASSKPAVISVSIKPGAITLQRMLREPNSKAVDLLKPIIAALEAE